MVQLIIMYRIRPLAKQLVKRPNIVVPKVAFQKRTLYAETAMVIGSTIGVSNFLIGFKEGTIPVTMNFIKKRFSNQEYEKDGHYKRLFHIGSSLTLLPMHSMIKGATYGMFFPLLAVDLALYPKGFGRHFIPFSNSFLFDMGEDIGYPSDISREDIIAKYDVSKLDIKTAMILGLVFSNSVYITLFHFPQFLS